MLQKRHAIIFIGLCAINSLDISVLAAQEPINPKILNETSITFSLPSDQPDKIKKFKISKFNEDTYDLAYKIYLQNNNTKDAFAVALSAVKQNPKSILWRKRFAQTAIWHQEPTLAAEQYLYLVQHFNDNEAMAAGLKLAQDMHDDASFIQFINIDIKNGNDKEENWKNYIDALLRLGEPDKVIALLNTNRNKFSSTFYLGNLARVYRLKSDPQGQLAALTQLDATNKIKPTVAQQLADIYLSSGDFNQAYEIMHDASKNAKEDDDAFWKDYVKVSRLANHSNEEVKAYKKLLNQKKPEEQVYTRLVELTKNTDLSGAFQYAKQGKQIYPESASLNGYLLSLIKETGQWEYLPSVMNNIPPSVSKLLRYDVSYWEANAYYWEKRDKHEKAVEIFTSAMEAIPSSHYMKSDYLFFLMASHDLLRISQALPLWQNSLPAMPQLWGAYAQAYARLGNSQMTRLIIQQFYDIFDSYKSNPYWLISFKDVLDSSFLPKESWYVNHYAWPLYLSLLSNQNEPVDYYQLVNYIKLSMQEAPGDTTGNALSILQNYPTPDVELLMLTWALDRRNYAQATAIYRYYKSAGIIPPSWASLSIALIHHDRYLMRELLTSKTEIASYRDQIQAAQDIDAISLAQQAAYEALEVHPHDSDLYDNYFTPVMLKTVDHFYFGQEFYQYGSAEGPRNNLYYTYFFSPSISITPYNSLWLSRQLPGGTTTTSQQNSSPTVNQVVTNMPPHDERAGLKIDMTQNRGTLKVDVGFRDNLNKFGTAKVSRSYKLFHDLDTFVAVGYHQQADDTLTLLIGGMKNYLFLRGNYSLTSKDSLLGEYSQNFFFTQDGEHVANGGQGSLRLEHKFWQKFPDWTISIYGTFSKYYDKTDTLTGSILTLVPVGITPTVNFLIPSNFGEYGVTASVGQRYIEDYTHTWRPFAAITLSNSTSVGPGKLFDLGVAGTVLGRDHLLLYYERGTNAAQGVQLTRLAKISYEMYF